MRHRNKTNGLGRTAAHRKAMLANMASSLILHKRIKTTVAKAKVLRTYIEPIITKSKDDSTTNRRTAFRYLRDKYAVSELFRAVTPKIGERPGGYTRILKLGNRVGDNAEICIIELVDFNTTYKPNEKVATKKRRSRRGGSKKTTTDTIEKNAVVEEKVEDTKEQIVEQTEQTKKEATEKVEDTVEQKEDTIETKEEPKDDKQEGEQKDETKE